MLKRIIAGRRTIQALVAAAVLGLFVSGAVTLGAVVLFGSLLGIIFGKVFCRWMCPMGLVMETMLGAAAEGRHRQLYMYYKLGCPIAWAGGLLNRASLVRVRRDAASCRDCGRCDRVCYMATLDPRHSHYKPDHRNPADAYSCSRCLECVGVCPSGSLHLGVRGGAASETPQPPA